MVLIPVTPKWLSDHADSVIAGLQAEYQEIHKDAGPDDFEKDFFNSDLRRVKNYKRIAQDSTIIRMSPIFLDMDDYTFLTQYDSA